MDFETQLSAAIPRFKEDSHVTYLLSGAVASFEAKDLVDTRYKLARAYLIYLENNFDHVDENAECLDALVKKIDQMQCQKCAADAYHYFSKRFCSNSYQAIV